MSTTNVPTSRTTPAGRPLDHFESQLLGELRGVVVERAAARDTRAAVEAGPAGPGPIEARRRRPVRRLVAGGAVAGLAASAAVVAGLGSVGGPAPAYAVSEDGNGDVVVTIHRLEDAAGLEKALRAAGIDADVSFSPDAGDGHSIVIPAPPDGRTASVPRSGAHFSGRSGGGQVSTSQGRVGLSARPGAHPRAHHGANHRAHHGANGAGSIHAEGGGELGTVKPGQPDKVCGWIEGRSPATLEHRGQDWVLTIPARSPLQNRHVDIGLFRGGNLSVFYAGNQPGSYCGVATATAMPNGKVSVQLQHRG